MTAAEPFWRSRPTQAGAGGRLVYAVGDVHGCYDLLKTLLEEIVRDSAERAAGRRPLLIFCGDYVDRGPHSAEVLEALAWLRRHSPMDVRLLKGNHEQCLLRFLEAPEQSVAWLRFGGQETLAAYGVPAPPADDDPAVIARARDELLEAMPAAHLVLLQSLEPMAAVGDYVFVHAGIRPGTALAEQAEQDLLWIREPFLEAAGPFEKIVVHGHTWTGEEVELRDHRIGLDTGAYATGVLSALRLDDGVLAVGQARRPALDSKP